MKTPKFQLAHRGSAIAVSRGASQYKPTKHTLVPLAVRARLVALELHQILERGAILFRPISGRVGPSRHCGVDCRMRRLWWECRVVFQRVCLGESSVSRGHVSIEGGSG
jgi:hypothetical protein